MLRNRHAVVFLLFAVSILMSCGHARAGTGTRTYSYAIQHEQFGDIGTYINIVKSNGDNVVVETRIDVEVKLLFIVLYRLSARREQVWHRGRLIAYKSVTEDNGEKVQVTGRAEDGKFVIQGPSGTVKAPAGIHPSNPWSISVIKAAAIMATQSGELSKMTATGGERQIIQLQDRTLAVRHFRITGDMELDLWYDQNDIAVKFSYVSDGETLVFSLVRPKPSVLAESGIRALGLHGRNSVSGSNFDMR